MSCSSKMRKSFNMLTPVGKKEHIFKISSSGCFWPIQKIAKSFKRIYFEEHLHTTASKNVFMKLRKIKICKEFNFTLKININIQNQDKKQVKMFVFIS